MATAKMQYSFPLLKPSAIFACIREMQIPVSDEEIRNCDPLAVRKVLEAFIETIMGVTRDEMSQPVFAGLNALSYPELHEESIPELTFFRTARKLMDTCGIYDFGMKDIISPTPKRVRRQLSALINFAKFREERIAAFSELTRETDRLLKKRTSLQDENERLQRDLQEILQAHAAEQPAIQQISQECAELESEINQLNKQQAIMRHEIGELKARNNEIRDDATSLHFTILEADKEIERLQSKIVNSPDRVKKEIEGIAGRLEDAKEELNAMERRHRELEAYSDAFARAEKDVLKTIQLLEETQEEMHKLTETKSQIKFQKKDIEKYRRQAMELVAQRKRLEKLCDQKREQLEWFRADSRIKDQAAEQALKAAQTELHQLESSQFDARQRITANNDASREWERTIREEELKYQKEIDSLQQMYKRLQIAAQFYNSQLLEVVRSSD